MRSINLTDAPIGKSLIKLALPITITGFIEMAYSITDMFWISREGAESVSAIGACSNFLWLATCFITTAKIGGQVKVGHCIGAKDLENTKLYARSAFQLGIIISLIFSILFMTVPRVLIGIFNFDSILAIEASIIYLRIQSIALPFQFSSLIFTGIFSALGNSKYGLIANSIGLVTNMILDPILILYFNMGVGGASLATLISQIIVFIVFVCFAKNNKILSDIRIFVFSYLYKVKDIIKIGFPAALQSSIFSIVSLFIGRNIAEYGTYAVGVQKLGAQLEAISWKTSDGLATSMNSFMAQNYGAKKIDRAKKGYHVGMYMIVFFGVISTLILMIFPRELMSIFFTEEKVISLGKNYLFIMSFSQFFICLEMVTNGALAGLGITFIPNILGIIIISSRVIFAPILANTTLGLNGIWIAITGTSILTGIASFCIYIYVWKKKFNKLIIR